MSQSDSTPTLAKASVLEVAFEILLILVVFFLHAGWPVPDVNEAHYLCKARHYWDATWGSGDFFLESADAHAVFFWTFGWLTLMFELPTVAWIGRVVTWLLLAWSWRRLSYSIAPRPLMSVLTAALLVALIDWTQMAGEWLVGGVEAKGFAYVLVFLALEAAVRSRWRYVWPLLGAASSFHPLVGGWSTIAVGFAWWWSGETRMPLRKMLPSLALGLLLALPGLYFALRLTVGIDTATVAEANEIMVFRRLRHHLVLWTFPDALRARHVGATVVFLVLCFCWRSERQEVLRGFVIGSLLISLAGAFVSLIYLVDERIAASLLRFYWYRLGDIALPMALSLMAAAALIELKPKHKHNANVMLVALMAVLGWKFFEQNRAMFAYSVARAERKITASFSGESAAFREKAKQHKLALEELHAIEWIDACQWIVKNTEPHDLFITPRMNQTFKWRTGRSEVVTHKDIPQDAEGIVEWWRRIDDLYRYESSDGTRDWRENLAEQGQVRLEELGWKYGAKYLLVEGFHPVQKVRAGMKPMFIKESFTIYELPAKE